MKEETARSSTFTLAEVISGLSKFTANLTKPKSYVIIGPDLEHITDDTNFQLDNQDHNIEIIYNASTKLIEFGIPN